MTRLVTAAVLVLAFGALSLAADDESKTWEGTWVNKLYGTTGPLKCVAKPGEKGKWSATFSGKFMNDPFSYDVTFDAKPGKGQQDLSGTATIRNHKYEWTGTMKGDTLTGKYKANSGYYGDFVLKAAKK